MIPEAVDRYPKKYATTKGSASCYRFCFAVIRIFDLSFQWARATSARHEGVHVRQIRLIGDEIDVLIVNFEEHKNMTYECSRD